MVGVGLEPEDVIEPEMVIGSFWVAPKVPQLKRLADRLLRVCCATGSIGSLVPMSEPVNGTLALNWYVTLLAG